MSEKLEVKGHSQPYYVNCIVKKMLAALPPSDGELTEKETELVEGIKSHAIELRKMITQRYRDTKQQQRWACGNDPWCDIVLCDCCSLIEANASSGDDEDTRREYGRQRKLRQRQLQAFWRETLGTE